MDNERADEFTEGRNVEEGRSRGAGLEIDPQLGIAGEREAQEDAGGGEAGEPGVRLSRRVLRGAIDGVPAPRS